MTARLEVDVTLRIGDLDLAVAFEETVAFTALFGPSGAGKTTTLEIIAGLRHPRQGCVRFDGETFQDSERRVFVAPHRRRVGYVFQDGRLFPHLSVESNLSYGRPKGERRFRRSEVVEVLGLGPLLNRRPGNLSGGEKQRAALGRAILSEPRLLLMDEPLASLDMSTRMRMLVYLKSVHEAFALPILYVSHDLASVVNFTDRMIYLENGRVQAIGPPYEALARARGQDVEGLVENTFEARVVGRHPEVGTLEVRVGETTFVTRDHDEPMDATVVVTFPASEVILIRDRPSGVSARNVIPGRVARVESLGPRRLVSIDVGSDLEISAEVVPETLDDLDLAPGRPVHALIKAAVVKVVR